MTWLRNLQMFVPHGLGLLRNASQKIPGLRKETEEEQAAKFFRYRFGRNPYLKEGDPETIDRDRLKEVFTNAMVACIDAIRHYHDYKRTPVDLSDKVRIKSEADFYRDADVKFDELALLCAVAHRFRPNVVPGNPVEIHSLYNPGSVQHSHKTVLENWQKKRDEAAAKAGQPKAVSSQ